MHMKCYLFDDHVILSGANLNDQYFTNRQDRYICIESRALADYLEQVIEIMGDYSQRLNSSGTFDSQIDVFNGKYRNRYLNQIGARLHQLAAKHCALSKSSESIKQDQVQVVPLVQFKSASLTQDEEFTKVLLQQLPLVAKQVRLTSGYFNLPRCYQTALLQPAFKPFTIETVAASEEASSFYRADGLLKYIPSVYTHLSQQFLRKVTDNKLQHILYRLYHRNNWTYHAKGLWLVEPDGTMLVTIGSPNFGHRSINRDVELQCVLYTKNKLLKAQFQAEYENIERHTSIVTNAKQLPPVSKWIQFLAPFIKRWF